MDLFLAIGQYYQYNIKYKLKETYFSPQKKIIPQHRQ